MVLTKPRKITVFCFALAILSLAGCQQSAPAGKNQPATTASPAQTTPQASPPDSPGPDATPRPSPRTPLEATLNDMAVFDFIQVLVITRSDGKPVEASDSEFIKTNAPQETNQWAKSTDGLHVVAGTNFVFKPAQLSALRTRFTVDDVTAQYGRKR